MDDKENFICSPDLIEYAIKRGWYDPKSGISGAKEERARCGCRQRLILQSMMPMSSKPHRSFFGSADSPLLFTDSGLWFGFTLILSPSSFVPSFSGDADLIRVKS